jgi:hypothetical protein
MLEVLIFEDLEARKTPDKPNSLKSGSIEILKIF